MKPLYAWTMLLVLALMPYPACAQNTEAAGAPSLHVPEPAFQFGSVVSGQDVSHDYRLQNRGAAPLKISRVKTA